MVKIFDSVYTSLDAGTLQVVQGLFGKGLEVTVSSGAPKQQGGNDCGVFSIAISTCLAFGGDPTKMVVCQASMRVQLLRCFEAKVLTVSVENCEN